LSLNFSFKIESTAKQEIVILSGYIDENANFEEICPNDNMQLIIDLKEVTT
jgi:hypothetical protein